MSIYHSQFPNNNFPYVYFGIHKETSQFYIGYRSNNKIQAHLDLGSKYFTSSKVIAELGFDKFNWIILTEYFTDTANDDSYWDEQRLIKQHIKDPLCLNKRYSDPVDGKPRFNSKGYTRPQSWKDAMSIRIKARPSRVMPEDEKIARSLVQKGRPGKKKTQTERDTMSVKQKGQPGRTFKPITIDGVYYASIKLAAEKHGVTSRQLLEIYKGTPVICNGIEYTSVKAASLALGVTTQQIRFKHIDNVPRYGNRGKPIVFNGISYPSMLIATKILGVSRAIIERSILNNSVELLTSKPNKVVSCDGVIYQSLSDAGRAMNLTIGAIKFRINSSTDRFKNYFLL